MRWQWQLKLTPWVTPVSLLARHICLASRACLSLLAAIRFCSLGVSAHCFSSAFFYFRSPKCFCSLPSNEHILRGSVPDQSHCIYVAGHLHSAVELVLLAFADPQNFLQGPTLIILRTHPLVIFSSIPFYLILTFAALLFRASFHIPSFATVPPYTFLDVFGFCNLVICHLEDHMELVYG